MFELIAMAVKQGGKVTGGESKNGFSETNQEATAEVQIWYDGDTIESADSRIREVLRTIQEIRIIELWFIRCVDSEVKGVHISMAQKIFSCE